MSRTVLTEDIHQYPIRPVVPRTESVVTQLQPEVNAITSYEMAVVTCHFNWAGFINPVRNLHRFIRQMKVDKIPLYGVELSLTDKFETTGMDGWKQIKVSKENICFQKEACINLAVQTLVPRKYKNVAWIDADMMFTNKNWYNETCKKLKTYKVVQLFRYIIETDRYGRETLAGQGSVFAGGPHRQGGRRAPGGAWAANRELWDHGGLYPFCPMGGGDTTFLFAIYHNSTPNTIEHVGKRPDYKSWRNKVYKFVTDPKMGSYNTCGISYVNGNFVHEWHGDREDRNYLLRQEIYSRMDQKNIKINSDGILEIADESDKMYDDILNYFSTRNEDGVFTSSQNSQYINRLRNKYDYCVVITTYDRPEMLKKLLQDIKKNTKNKNVLTIVFDDGSPTTFDYASYDIKYIKYVNNYGKKNFWKLIDDTFKYIQNIEAKYYFYLQDDVRMADNFFDTAVSVYESIPDKSKICLSTLTVEAQVNGPKFTRETPVWHDQYIKTQWCEFFFMAERAFFEKLNYEIFLIDESRWQKNELLGSGVGQQISERLTACNFSLYHTKNTLLSHGDHSSKMNPDDRKSIKLVAEL